MASEAEEENRVPALRPRLLEGESAFPFNFVLAELSNPHGDTRTGPSQ